MAIQKIKLDLGTVYQKEEGGIYYFRYQVNGARKAISLKTRNQKEALKEANKQIPLLKATSAEIIAAVSCGDHGVGNRLVSVFCK